MKTFSRVIISHVIFLSLFGLATYAFAQTEEAMPPSETAVEETLTPEQRQAKNEAMKAELRESVDATREERRANLDTRANERITNLAANLSNRIEAVIVRMQNIIDRIDTRIEKLTERGVDTSEAEESLASAQASVDSAKLAIADIDTQVALAVGSEDVRTAWQTVKAIFITARDHLKESHTLLRACVASLKTAVAEMEEENGASSAVQSDQAEVSE